MDRGVRRIALQIWLPLNGDIHNQGLIDATPTVGGTSVAVNNSGKIGKCYSFGTASGYINIPVTDIKKISGSCTVAFWLNIRSFNTAYATVFSANRNSAAWAEEMLTFQRDNNTSAYTFHISNGSSSTTNACKTGTLSTGVWYHFVLVADTELAQMRIYQNGELITTYNTSIIPNLGSILNFRIGVSSTGYQADILLNDFRLYDEVLPVKVIKELSKGLVLHYPLCDNSIQTLNNCYSLPTFETTGWSHWGRSGASGSSGQSTDTNYIFRSGQIYAHWVSNAASATGEYLLYQSPAFEGGSRSLQCICKEENGLEINESIVFPAWNARSGGAEQGKWTSVSSLGNGFYLCKCEDIQQNGSNDLVGFYICPGYKVYFSEAYLENDKTICSDVLFSSNTVYDASGYMNNGTVTGELTCTIDTPRYLMSTVFDGTQKIAASSFTSEIKTMSVWVKTTKDKNTSQFVCADSASKLCISFYKGCIISYFAASGHSTGSRCTLGSSYIENGWNHIVVVSTGSGTRDVYCNGVKLTPTTNDYWSYTSAGFTVGARNSNTPCYFYGYISDVRAYTTALSADDVLDLYHTPASITNNGVLMTQGEIVEV